MVISPDEGGMSRAIYIANVLGLDMGMFYKRRDYTRIVNGRNPIVAHEFLGSDVEGKDMLIIDDMISSGESVREVAAALKKRKARRSSYAPPSVCSPTAWMRLTKPIRKASSTAC